MHKKILIIFWGHPLFDGRCMNMIDQLLIQNHKVIVLGVGQKGGDLYYKNTQIKLFDSRLLSNSMTKYFKYFKYVKHFIQKTDMDIIIASDLYSMIPSVQTKNCHKAKILYDSRELYTKLAGLINKPLIQRIWAAYEKKYILKVDYILVTANIDKIYLQKLYQHPKIKIIKNLPGDSFLNNESIDVKNMLNLENDDLIFLYQGKFHNGRGIRFSIKCLSKIKKAVLVLIGDGPMKNQYLETAEIYNMKNRVFVLDPVPYHNLGAFASTADIGLSLIQPISKSYEHALPNKLFEYAISGLPCICSNFEAMQDMIDMYNSGIAINHNNEHDFINAYKQIINHYDNYILKIGDKKKLLWNVNNYHLCEIIND